MVRCYGCSGGFMVLHLKALRFLCSPGPVIVGAGLIALLALTSDLVTQEVGESAQPAGLAAAPTHSLDRLHTMPRHFPGEGGAEPALVSRTGGAAGDNEKTHLDAATVRKVGGTT